MHSTRRQGRNAALLLGFALVLGGAARCSVEPLMSGSDGGAGSGGHAGTTGTAGTMGQGGSGNVDGGPCSGMPIPALGCAVGRTIPVCTINANGLGVWMITCPDDPTGAGGAGGGGSGGSGGSGGAPCGSSSSCVAGEVCTTEDGVCNSPPGCTPTLVCPGVCYGNCRPDGPACGAIHCATGMVCCNDSCGTCTEPNGGCTKQICVPPVGGGSCTGDADCRLEADYCTGCDCRGLAPGQSIPPCSGPGVRCLVDPCSTRTARCVNGLCTAVAR